MNDELGTIGIVLGAVAISFVVLLLLVIVYLLKRVKRLERKMISIKNSPKDGGIVEKQDVTELSPVRKQSIPTPQLTRPVAVIDPSRSYENTKPAQLAAVDDCVLRKKTGDNYTEVPDSLPAFLRNEAMLLVPEVTDEDVKKAQKDFDESYARLSTIRIENNDDYDDNSDYIDPQDARDKIVSSKAHQKLDNRVLLNKRLSGESVSLAQTSVTNREDYSVVCDIGNEPIPRRGYRPRTTSDTSPIKKTTPANLRKKAESLKRPDHFENSKSQPLSRRKSGTAKEMVTFDPKAGFKLSAKRTVSDGSPRPHVPIILADSKSSSSSNSETPVEETKPVLLKSDVGGVHMYAAVDLTAKCRPESDIVRREGVGTPDHYVACI